MAESPVRAWLLLAAIILCVACDATAPQGRDKAPAGERAISVQGGMRSLLSGALIANQFVLDSTNQDVTLSRRSNGLGATFARTSNDFTLSLYRNNIATAPTSVAYLEFEGLSTSGASRGYGMLDVMQLSNTDGSENSVMEAWTLAHGNTPFKSLTFDTMGVTGPRAQFTKRVVIGNMSAESGWLHVRTQSGSMLHLDDALNLVWSGGAYIDGGTISEPGAPASGHFRLYADDSAGHTRLLVKFSSGAPRTIAVQP